jgi:UTP-glucose-1-phosphate uridylyltransferase
MVKYLFAYIKKSGDATFAASPYLLKPTLLAYVRSVRIQTQNEIKVTSCILTYK